MRADVHRIARNLRGTMYRNKEIYMYIYICIYIYVCISICLNLYMHTVSHVPNISA